MKRFFRNALIGLFLVVLLLGGITVHTIVQSQSYGRLINYVGIVRGATQRLVKLEMNGTKDDSLIEYLDGILKELTEGKGPYKLPAIEDDEYLDNLKQLDTMWGQLKEQILKFREGNGDRSELLALSEKYFEKANDTVFSADTYASSQTRLLLIISIVMLAAMLVTWLFIFWAASKKMVFLEKENRELNAMSRRDQLTGAYHLEEFKEEAQRLIDQGKHKNYAVVYTDFVDFKYINDVFGYNYGDDILTRYGEILREEIRDDEIYGRVSADNFVLLLWYEDKTEIAIRQQKSDESITAFMHNSCSGHVLPTSCGICCIEDVIEDLKIGGFLDRANFARKTVKNGTNQNYVYYDESIRNRLRVEKDIEIHMQDALTNREFIVYYQPKVSLKTGKISNSEALVRWESEEGKVISPNYFIPVFERKHMIHQLDQYVFEEVCRWLRHMLDENGKALPVSVNVSRLQFYDQEFVSKYVEIRDRYQIPHDLLEIEFTESIVFGNTELLQNTVEALKREGFSCSIDDFGKGYSSLSMLKTLPIDTLKIDRFFFTDWDKSERDMAVVQGIIDLVKKFNIHTVAEGIETQEQVAYLKQAGCDYVQGYVFYKPMPQSEFEALLLSDM